MLWRIGAGFGGRVVLMQWLSLVSAAIALGVGYLYLVRWGYCSRRDAVFAVCSARALRGTGIAFVVVILGHLLWRRRRVRWVAATAAVLVLPWIVRMVSRAGTWEQDRILGYQQDYVGWWSTFARESVVRLLLGNARMIVESNAVLLFQGVQPFLLRAGSMVNVGVLWLAGLAMVVLLPLRGPRRGVVVWAVAGYLALIAVWPWPPDRFLVPIVLVLAASLVGGVRIGIERAWSATAARTIVAALVVLAVLANGIVVRELAGMRRRFHYPYLPVPQTAVAWRSFTEVFDWLREHSQPTDVVAAPFDSMTWLYTGRVAFRPYVLDTAAAFYGGSGPVIGTVDDLRRVLAAYAPRYLVVTPVPGSIEDAAYAALVRDFRAQHRDDLRPVFSGSDRRFAIFEVAPPGGASILRQRPRTVREDDVAFDPERHPYERPAAGRARDALARLGTVVRPVGGTLHEAPVLGEELVLHPVEAHRHVPAAVDVRVQRAAVVQQERLDLVPVAVEEELLRLAGRELPDARDRDAHARTTRR